MEAAARCNIGACRMVNQDRVFSSDEPVGTLPNLFIVADGMGGHAAGERASAETVDFCVQFIKDAWSGDTGDVLCEMAECVNRHVYELASSHVELNGMGTTLVAASICEDGIYCVNVGDSRMYVVNQEDQLERVTMDHSVVEMMMRRGELTEEEARNHPNRNYITRAIGTEKTVRADLYKVPAGYARMMMLCSDGLSGQVANERIEEILKMRSLSLSDRVDMLVGEANRNGGTDNISVILADLERGKA